MSDEKATEKQIGFGRKLGVEDIEKMTKTEARLAIDRKLGAEDKPKEELTGGHKDWEKFPEKTQQMPAVKEFHLTEEAIRSNALASAIQYCMTRPNADFEVVKSDFEKYIRG